MGTSLITGHDGFIGTHLVDSLKKNHDLLGISRTKSKSTIKQVQMNILKLDETILPKKISTIFHLAAISDVNFCQKNPTKTTLTNILGTQKILELARKKDAKLIFLSTSHVYGHPKKLPISESNGKHPQSIYASTKLSGEILCESYSHSYGMDVGIARLFSIYGPNNPKHSVVNNIIKQILFNNKIQLGNINTKRDFLYVKDAVKAIKLISMNIRGFDDYNIGSGKSTSIKQICDILKKISHKSIPIEEIKTQIRKNDTPNFVSNIHKIRKLGWKQTISLEQGLTATFDWYESSINR